MLNRKHLYYVFRITNQLIGLLCVENYIFRKPNIINLTNTIIHKPASTNEYNQNMLCKAVHLMHTKSTS